MLKVENISKQYRLGLVGASTLGHDMKRWWYKVRGKDDPFLKVGDVNDRSVSGDSDYVWALKDINFEVKQGEVLGIIGKNGAGKSTLLKILSRVTGPTTGEIKSKGKIASLLEVGTGFHPELTGRENIYLNGAILGMTKAEIKQKEEEIIAFSGCERYVDTPVKRYSSGMRVRLAFAVAAFLEPDILVIDEVLAVGDAEFQKKAVGKMQEISKGDGRTVLFVSHNMAAVKSLCTRAIVLEHGKVVFEGSTDKSIQFYLTINNAKGTESNHYFDKGEFNDKEFAVEYLKVISNNSKSKGTISRSDSFSLEIKVDKKQNKSLNIIYRFKDEQGQFIFVTSSVMSDVSLDFLGNRILSMHIPELFFNEGVFSVDIMISDGKKNLYLKEDVVNFVVIQEKKKLGNWLGKTKGSLKPRFNWEVR